jgi:cell division protein FtsN
VARDYKSYSSNHNHKKAKSGGNSKFLAIAVVAIVIIVLLIAGFHKISQRKLAKQAALVTETKTGKKEKIAKKPENATADADTTTDDSAPQQPEIKFEFYNILPNEKVADNSAVTSEDAATHIQAAAPKSEAKSTETSTPTSPAAAAKATEKTNTAAASTTVPKGAAPTSSAPKPATLKPTVDVPIKKAATPVAANGYIVQVVSVRNLHDADVISTKLKTDGFNVQTIKIYSSGAQWYRIQVGPYKTMDDALSAQMTLRKNNYHAILLKPKN